MKLTLEQVIEKGAWEELFIHVEFKELRRDEKIIVLFRTLQNHEKHLDVVYFEMVREDHPGVQEMLLRFRKIKQMRQYLSACLSWKGKGEPEGAPKEISELLKE